MVEPESQWKGCCRTAGVQEAVGCGLRRSWIRISAHSLACLVTWDKWPSLWALVCLSVKRGLRLLTEDCIEDSVRQSLWILCPGLGRYVTNAPQTLPFIHNNSSCFSMGPDFTVASQLCMVTSPVQGCRVGCREETLEPGPGPVSCHRLADLQKSSATTQTATGHTRGLGHPPASEHCP